MTAKLLAQHLEVLGKRWQELQDKAAACPEAWEALAPAIEAVSQAIRALRAAGESLPAATAGGLETPAGEVLTAASPAPYETILSNIFNAIPDLVTVIDRDYNIVMTNWHRPEVPEEFRRPPLKCYRVYHGRERPCEDCHVQKVFATGQPLKVEKSDELTNRVLEFTVFPIPDESGQVAMVAEHVQDIQERYLAEKALRESETKYRTLVENIPQKVFIKNRDSRYVSCNQNFARDLGIRPEEVLGKVDYDFFPRKLADKYRADDKRIMETGRAENIEERYIQDGKETLVNTIKTPVKDENTNIVGVLGIFHDITARKQAEEALRKSEELYRSLFKNMLNGLAYCKMIFEKNQPLDFVFLEVNSSFEALTGLQNVIGKKVSEAIPGIQESDPELFEIYGRVALTGKSERFEIYLEALQMWFSISTFSPAKEYFVAVFDVITARKQAEEALKKSEERFRHISSTISDISYSCAAAPEGVYAIDWMAGAVERITGYSLEEIKARRCWRFLVIGEDQPLFEKYVAGLAVGSSGACELRLRHQNGQIVWVASFAEIVGQPEQPELLHLYGGLVDITARKQAEEALRESEKRFRDITESAAEWVWEVDAQGQYIYSSPVVEQLLGYKPEEILGKHFYDFFIPEERETLKQAALAAFAAKQPFTGFLNPNLHKNSQIVWLSTSGIPLLDEQGDLRGYRGADINITARREAEEFSHNLIAKSPFGIYLLQDRKLQQVNQSFCTITGYREDELANLEPIELIHSEDREATRENINRMLKGLSSVPYEYRTITKGGETKWIMETVASIQYQGKRAVLGYFIDITERKQLENQLLQAQKMEAVGRLAGGVAHDFNNLLMAITGYGELMEAKVLKDDPLHDHLDNMLKASERAASLTRQLLTFSRQQIAHRQVIDLNRVVLDMEQILRRLIGEDIDLEITATPGPVAVKADPGYLGQVIMNLVVNARDAMPRGGRLTLKTAAVEVKERRPARFGPVPPGAYVMLVVQDTGVGMDEATQAHIFEPFFTTKEPGKGTGLGLSTVYGIVNQNGGYIAVDSEPGTGSTFTIYLPRLDGIAAPPQAKIPLTAEFRGEETILLVEDEDVLRNLLTKFLRFYGYTVLDARHGGEALLLCERHQGPIHLMVTDVVMPQMSGRELADRLAPLRPDMKVIYMSGYADDSMVQYGVTDLAVPFLQKPFKSIELARKVHAVLHSPEGP